MAVMVGILVTMPGMPAMGGMDMTAMVTGTIIMARNREADRVGGSGSFFRR